MDNVLTGGVVVIVLGGIGWWIAKHRNLSLSNCVKGTSHIQA